MKPKPVLTQSPPSNIINAKSRFGQPTSPVQLEPSPVKKNVKPSPSSWWLLMSLVGVAILVAVVTNGHLLVKPEGRETQPAIISSLPSEPQTLPEVKEEIPTTAEPQLPPVPTSQELLAKIETYLATGQDEATVFQTVEQLKATNEEAAVRKAVSLLTQLSQASSLEPQILRLVKIVPRLCPVLEADVQGYQNRLAQETEPAQTEAEVVSVESPPSLPPPVPLPNGALGIGVSTKIVTDLQRVLKAQGPKTQWQVVEIQKVGPLTKITFKQVDQETNPIIWFGIPLLSPQKGQIVSSKSLLDMLFP